MYQKYQKVPKYIKYTKMFPYVSQCFPMYPKANCKKYTKNWKALFDLVKVIIMVLYYGYMQYRFSRRRARQREILSSCEFLMKAQQSDVIPQEIIYEPILKVIDGPHPLGKGLLLPIQIGL